jgi:methyl halide transferase
MLAARPTTIGRAFVPGCGTGYDVFAIAEVAEQVVGLDVAPSAAERFEAERGSRGIDAGRATIVVGDFFGYTPPASFDLIWDYTFLCAIEPDQRLAWADRMHELLTADGELWTLIFPVDPVPLNPGGPPHPMTTELVRELLEPRFVADRMEPVSVSHPGRQGKEWLACWRKAV